MSNLTSSRLHEATLRRLTDIIENGVTVETEDGAINVDPSPQYIAQAVNFLKAFPPDIDPIGGEKTSGTLSKYGNNPY